MAGVKITDLTPLSTVASGDLLYIVDVSDTTESPQGTSKSIEVGNIVSSGIYYPSFTIVTGNFEVSSIEGDAFFHKSENFVQFFLKLRIRFLSDNIAEFSMTLPFSSSGNSHRSNAICSLMYAQTTGGAVVRNTNIPIVDEMEFQFETENSSDDTYEFNVIGNYIIS